jgi:hypothetical protein
LKSFIGASSHALPAQPLFVSGRLAELRLGQQMFVRTFLLAQPSAMRNSRSSR